MVGIDGERFRRQVLDVWGLTNAEQQLLELACSTLDTVVALEAQVAADGLMVDGSKGQRVLHPAVGEARAQRLAFARLLGQLGLPNQDGQGETISTPEAVRAHRAAQARWRRAAERR